jgi:hypothetical protein
MAKCVRLTEIIIVGSMLGVSVGCAQEPALDQEDPPPQLSSQSSAIVATHPAPGPSALRDKAIAAKRLGVVAAAVGDGDHLRKAQSTSCLVARVGSGERPVQQTPCATFLDQEWEFVFPFPIPDNRLQIRNIDRNQCIVTRGRVESNAVTTGCNPGFADQLWNAEWDTTFRGYRFRNANSGLCLVARSNSNAVQTTCGAFSDQVWHVHRVPSDYDITAAQGFGTLPPAAQRVVTNIGARPGALDQIISMRWFIPSLTAAGGLLMGDNRDFDSSPDAPEDSRATLTWEPRTGRASFTINGSDLLSGLKLPALPIRTMSSCAAVRSTDLSPRPTNDVFIGATSTGIQLCVSLLNSLTNQIGVASWSVDVSATITLDSFGNPQVNMLGNGYPAIELYAWSSVLDGAGTFFKRRVDPFVSRTIDEGGGLAALDLESWFRCTQDATFENASVCFWDRSMVNPNRDREFYFTPWF